MSYREGGNSELIEAERKWSPVLTNRNCGQENGPLRGHNIILIVGRKINYKKRTKLQN
jgi:hypothetical protein